MYSEYIIKDPAMGPVQQIQHFDLSGFILMYLCVSALRRAMHSPTTCTQLATVPANRRLLGLSVGVLLQVSQRISYTHNIKSSNFRQVLIPDVYLRML